MSWLDCPSNQDDVKRSDFINWVEKYLLPNSEIKCPAVDLYSARCSMIHSFTFESTKVREGKANPIVYSFGKRDPKKYQELLDKAGFCATAVSIDQLSQAFKIAVDDFKEYLFKHPEKAKIAYERANKFFISTPPLYEELELGGNNKMGSENKKRQIYEDEKLRKALDLLADVTGDENFTIISTSELLDNPEADGLVIFAGNYFKIANIHDNLHQWIERELLPAMKRINSHDEE